MRELRATERALLRWAVLAASLLSGACSAIVDVGSDAPNCVTVSGTFDPCFDLDPGLACRKGRCRACENPRPETCNIEDDDCDGRIDEGSDQDGDGFTWCGGELADCVDTDPNIHPSAPAIGALQVDVCNDGLDNDCTGVPDDNPDCGMIGNCQDADTPCPNNATDCIACAPGLTCEPCPNGRCGVRQTICQAPLMPGSRCTTDSDCISGLCVEGAALGLEDASVKVCSIACCSDRDCGESGICLVPGNGTRLCVPAGLAGGVMTGEDQPCDSGLQCASRACDRGSDDALRCRRLCTTDADCVGSPHGAACVFRQDLGFIAPVGFVCGDPGGAGGLGAPCAVGSQSCDSGLCPGLASLCTESCRSACSAEGFACRYESTAGYLPLITTRLPYCVPSTGASALGQTCMTNDDCSQGACIDGACANTCCSDIDCINNGRCRPYTQGDGYGMYCSPSPLE